MILLLFLIFNINITSIYFYNDLILLLSYKFIINIFIFLLLFVLLFCNFIKFNIILIKY